MAQEPPSGYQEIGESIAQAVAEGIRGDPWAIGLAKMLGYKAVDVRRWVEYYREIHSEELLALQRLKQRKSRKVARWKSKSQALRQSDRDA